MLTAAETTGYSYTPGGGLAGEDGPWPSDTVTNDYFSRVRANLSLQQPTGFPFKSACHGRGTMRNTSPLERDGLNVGLGVPADMFLKLEADWFVVSERWPSG